MLQTIAVARADHVIAVSRALGERMAPRSRSVLVAPEVDWDDLTKAAAGVEERRPEVALFVGRLEREKAPDIAIAAAALAETVSVLRVVGRGSMKEELQTIADSVTGSVSVEFVDSLTHAEVLREMRKARVLMVPSVSEGFGLAGLEGLCMGAAVLASDAGGLPESVGWSERGHVLASRDPRVWADVLDSAKDGAPLSEDGLRQLRRRNGWLTASEVLGRVRGT